MEKAFDKVWHSGLLYKILKTKIPRRIVRVVASFLEGRSYHVAVEGLVSETHPIAAGVPQGSCLSPILYCCYTDDIPLVERNVELALYADDAAYFSFSLNEKQAVKYMQSQLDLLPAWMDAWRLTANVQKTQAIMFRGQGRGIKRSVTLPPLTLSGQALVWSPTVTYLGVKLDSRLTMGPQVRSACVKASVARNRLRPVLSSRLPLHIKVSLYKTYIRPITTYAAPAWYALCSKINKAKMQKHQNKSLRHIVNAPRYMRNDTISRDLRMEALDDFICRLAARMFSRADASDFPHLRDLTPLHARPPDAKRLLPRDLVRADSDSDGDSDDSTEPSD